MGNPMFIDSYTAEVPVVGGGVIGLSIGWQLMRAGIPAVVYETDCPKASDVAAGMLAPHAEAAVVSARLLEFGRESLSLFPHFLDELAEDSGVLLPFEKKGTLLVGIGRDDAEWLSHIYNANRVPMRRLSGEEARALEPLLSPRVTHALLIENEASLDPKAFMSTLKKAFLARGGEIRRNRIEDPPAHGVIAAGVWSSFFGAKVRPVKGQILTLKATFPLRWMIRSPRIYLTPNGSSIRIGATSEETAFNSETTGEALRVLLQDGWEILPALDFMPFVSFDAGLWPATDDHLPLIEQKGGLFFATGHGRSGFLLAPYTAYKIKEMVCRFYSTANSRK